jgi:hypothetical protein
MSVTSRMTVWLLPWRWAMTRLRFEGGDTGKLDGGCVVTHGVVRRGSDATRAGEAGSCTIGHAVATGVDPREDEAVAVW